MFCIYTPTRTLPTSSTSSMFLKDLIKSLYSNYLVTNPPHALHFIRYASRLQKTTKQIPYSKSDESYPPRLRDSDWSYIKMESVDARRKPMFEKVRKRTKRSLVNKVKRFSWLYYYVFPETYQAVPLNSCRE